MHQNTQFNIEKQKSSTPWEGGHPPRSLRSLAGGFQEIWNAPCGISVCCKSNSINVYLRLYAELILFFSLIDIVLFTFQCEQAESEMEKILKQRRDLVVTCVEILKAYYSIVNLVSLTFDPNQGDCVKWILDTLQVKSFRFPSFYSLFEYCFFFSRSYLSKTCGKIKLATVNALLLFLGIPLS